jgi:hypothetical protein
VGIAVLIAAQLVGLWFATRHSYFSRDDYLVFERAQEWGLTLAFLRMDLFHHFAPFNRFVHWLVQRLTPLEYPLAHAIILLLIGANLVVFALILKTLRTRGRTVVAAVFLVGTSLPVLKVGLWWGSAVHILPAALGIQLVLLYSLRYELTGQRKWLVASWIAFALSLLTQERPLVAIGYLGLLRYLVLPERFELRPLPLRFLRDLPKLWLPYFLLAAAALINFIKFHHGPVPPAPFDQLVRFFGLTGGKYFLPGLLGYRQLGGPGAQTAATWVSLALFVLLVVLTVRARPSSWRVWTFFALGYLANMGALGMGRVGLYGAELVSYDLQYYVDVTLLFALTLGLIDRAPEGETPSVTRGELVALGAGAVVILAMFIPSASAEIAGANRDAVHPRSFFANLRADLERAASGPPFSLISLRTPEVVVPQFIDPYNRHHNVVTMLSPKGIDPRSTDRRVIDTHGNLLPTRVQRLAVVEPAAAFASSTVELHGATHLPREGGPLCLRVMPSGGIVKFMLPRPVSAGLLVLELDYETATELEIDAATISADNTTFVPFKTALPAGSNSIVIPLDAQSADSTALVNIPEDTELCLSRVALSTVTTAPDAEGICRSIGHRGELLAPTPCGEPWDKTR